MEEEACPPDSFYQTEEYRTKLQAGIDTQDYLREHDDLQFHTLKAIWPQSLRDLIIADIGAAGGSLLDCFKGIAAKMIAIEPYDLYRDALFERGYEVYPYAKEAQNWQRKIDFAFSIQVIEHIKNPILFLSEIRELLTSEGRLVISTPNRNDILFSLLPDLFPSFFYRTVHRWYFDESTLTLCAQKAGFKVDKVNFVHRYGMSNTLKWLSNRKTGGHNPLPNIDTTADSFWKSYLERSGHSDCLYMILSHDE